MDDPSTVSWRDPETQALWHESVGCLVVWRRQILCFERSYYPFAYSIPAGHLEVGETPLAAIAREVEEEVGIAGLRYHLFTQEDIAGDKCRRGVDNHRWHLFVAKTDQVPRVRLNDEGKKPVWLTLDALTAIPIVFPLKYLIDRYGGRLVA